ncbi:cryptochrome/photolyase family protein [Natronobacterium gregoryi]|nr:cryptochrome/photolyase family protein [Natronobacterium gregoryi]AFZ73815.1 deoxyribodipyrimidine photolyase-related protein [Natronobacterium gregoryi SP2]PLK19729.1 cryptochrome/photolyase family protein [Natronobacterium gregoryi SP2]SFJ41698.1 deoxyribodipyrimidine photolyase-related protein [Natronobacterium gregoryi]
MSDERRVPWILGTHLHPAVGPLERAPTDSRVLLIEAHDFARRKRYHHHKLTIVFAGMRQFRDTLRERGYEVEYIKAETFADGLATYFDRYPDDELVQMRSPSHRSAETFESLVEDAGGALDVVQNELFVGTRKAFDEWSNATDKDPFRHETFYRWMRQQTGVLMTDDGEPVGGEWNYDSENQDFPPESWDSPPVLEPEHDELTQQTSEWIAAEFDTWGSTTDLVWPVTRAQAKRKLDHFVANRLPSFGPYQDAMRSDDWAMAHALLGSSINLGLLHPWEAVTAIEQAYHERDEIPLNSAEGVVRQLIGWREFMRHVYRHEMPQLATANQLDAGTDLPAFYWTGNTNMSCLRQTIGAVRDRGYAHHIQRLMVLANFATLWGVQPAQLNEWFHATYVDAYHWVTTPNVVEMGQYGDGVFASKPYVSSANYIDKMSDYCSDCRYDKTKDTGNRACPFNALYWDFLDRNEDKLRSNHRMGLMYSHVDSKQESGAMTEIKDRVETLRQKQRHGEL